MTTDSHKIFRPALILFATLLLGLHSALAQQPEPAGASLSAPIKLDVVVYDKSGQPIINLAQQDFSILDNKVPRPITSFKVVSAADEPVEVILLIDAINMPFNIVSYVHQNVEKFLRAHEGKLSHPTAIAVVTDQGGQFESGFSTDGNALNDSLEHHMIGLRQTNRSSEWGWFERQQICLNAFHQLLTFASTLPGRKIVLWFSPGWPLLSGPRIYLTEKQSQQIFSTVVDFSTQMRQANTNLYNINPVGAGQSLVSASYYEVFLKGATGPDDVQLGSLGVQVLATQSGGLAIESENDLTGNIQKCLADVQSWYEITFDPPPTGKPNDYHQIQIKLDKPKLVARTRTGYYSNPQILAP